MHRQDKFTAKNVCKNQQEVWLIFGRNSNYYAHKKIKLARYQLNRNLDFAFGNIKCFNYLKKCSNVVLRRVDLRQMVFPESQWQDNTRVKVFG